MPGQVFSFFSGRAGGGGASICWFLVGEGGMSVPPCDCNVFCPHGVHAPANIDRLHVWSPHDREVWRLGAGEGARGERGVLPNPHAWAAVGLKPAYGAFGGRETNALQSVSIFFALNQTEYACDV